MFKKSLSTELLSQRLTEVERYTHFFIRIKLRRIILFTAYGVYIPHLFMASIENLVKPGKKFGGGVLTRENRPESINMASSALNGSRFPFLRI